MDYDGREYGDVLLDIEDGLRAIADMRRAIIQAGVETQDHTWRLVMRACETMADETRYVSDGLEAERAQVRSGEL